MSIQIALDNIFLRPCDRWGHSEYSLEYHTPLMEKHTGLKAGHPELHRRTYEVFGIDFLFYTHDGPIDWGEKGRITNMGHATYATGGSDQHDAHPSPFHTEEEVWAFDAVEEYGLPDFDELVHYYEHWYRDTQRALPGQLVPGGYYKTIVSGAIQSFGWDMLLTAASDAVKMEKVFDSFYRRTLYHMKAWAKTSAPVVIQHDDFVWTTGAFMMPDIYRKVIIPRYAEMWKALHAAGKKVLFCSDGNFMEFARDIVEAGADGLIFEPVNDFDWMVDNFGKTSCLIGSFVDCRDLTFDKWDKVRIDIDRTFERLADCKGALLAVGNHVPPNIPIEMMENYFEYLLPRLKR